jgi:hypothetical protein
MHCDASGEGAGAGHKRSVRVGTAAPADRDSPFINHESSASTQEIVAGFGPKALTDVHPRATGEGSWGARRSDFMAVRGVRLEQWLSAFALTIFDTLGLGLPLAVAIIWICYCLEALNLI